MACSETGLFVVKLKSWGAGFLHPFQTFWEGPKWGLTNEGLRKTFSGEHPPLKIRANLGHAPKLGILFETPTPTDKAKIRTKIWPLNC